MPTYEYACKDCGGRLEVVQSFTDDALTECPTCQGQLRKVFGAVGISFKGSGFYKNDSRSKPKSSSSTTSTSESPSEGSSTEATSTDSSTKTEPKPEAKKEAKTESPASNSSNSGSSEKASS